ncbi:MAG: elongation factor P [bacterium]
MTDFRNGMLIEEEGQIYTVVSFQHVSPGNWRAFVRAKLKNLDTGNIIEKRFSADDKVNEITVDEYPMQFLYHMDGNYHFMNTETYEQIFLSEEEVGDNKYYLKENVEVNITFYKGKPISLKLPNFVDLRVDETGPNFRGDTVSSNSKPATLETGLVVQVPVFVETGEVVRVDTRTGQYVERVK